MNKRKRKATSPQIHASRSVVLADACYAFLQPLLAQLNQTLDRRLVQTLLGVVLAILSHRHRGGGLLLSELGACLLSPERAVAGTKRLSNLLHSARWASEVISHFLWRQADQTVSALVGRKEEVLAVWDESVIEKPESLHLQGLGPVRSAKAARLQRIKPGYFNPPADRPTFVPGLNWLAVMVMGRSGLPTLATMRWWTTRGDLASTRRDQEQAVLTDITARWGQQVLHIWDRGFAGMPWLARAVELKARFVVRWPKRYRVLDPQGQLRKVWEVARGKRSWHHRLLYDARRRCQRKTGVVALRIADPLMAHPLWLVVARPGQGRPPWYLVTNEPIQAVDDAWRIVLAYARRWQIEMAFRFTKSELAFESPRLRHWAAHHKLLMLATLAYAFLLSLLVDPLQPLRAWLLDTWCPRNDKRSRFISAPLYRLRSALARLWLAYPPPFIAKLNSG